MLISEHLHYQNLHSHDGHFAV